MTDKHDRKHEYKHNHKHGQDEQDEHDKHGKHGKHGHEHPAKEGPAPEEATAEPVAPEEKTDPREEHQKGHHKKHK